MPLSGTALMMSEPRVVTQLLASSDPAIRRLAGDPSADPTDSPRVRGLLEFPDDVHPYRKWWGTHWRLVELADLGVTPPPERLRPAFDRELRWLAGTAHVRAIRPVNGLFRVCASQEGNALYACSRLGFADDPRVRMLVDNLLAWQWPDGGWNCNRKPDAHRSSFHETVTPALGLVAFHQATGDDGARAAALRSAELFLEHRLFRRLADGTVIHPSWVKLHYPAYWHYDIGQGLRLLQLLGLLDEPRAQDALDVVEHSRSPDGRFSGPAWSNGRMRAAVGWGQGPDNEMLNLRAASMLRAAGRAA